MNSINNFTVILSFLILTSLVFSQQKKSFLSNYDFSKTEQIIKLQKEIENISDVLEVSDKLLILTHGSENIFQVDNKSGILINSLPLSNELAKEKLESICSDTKNYFTVDKNGEISQLTLSADKGFTRQQKYSTKLNDKNNVSGVSFNPKSNQLMLLCKDEPGFALRGVKAIYLFDLKSIKLENFPSIMIHLSELKKKYNLNEFAPIDLEYNSTYGNIIILSSKEPAVIEMSLRGEILDCIKLNKQNHPNPQSIILSKDGAVIVSDNSAAGSSKLIFYNEK